MSAVSVFLQLDVPSLGRAGDLVRVKPGYARNYLFPEGFAVPADQKNRKMFEHQKRAAQVKKDKVLAAANALAATIRGLSLTIQKLVGEEERIFGSVTHNDLADAFAALGHHIDRRSITVLDDIKRLGVYKGSVKLHPEVSAEFSIWVVAQAGTPSI